MRRRNKDMPKGPSRDAVLAGRPVKMPLVSSEEIGSGGIRLCVMLTRPRWQRFLGGSEQVQRKFELDSIGYEVYQACDGKTDVAGLVEWFADKYRVSRPESEISVTKFLQMLMMRNLVGMEMDRKKEAQAE